MTQEENLNGQTLPKAERPNMPGYGIHEATEGMLEWEWASARLEKSHNYWVCSTRPDGRPHAMPVWGVWWNEALYFSTSRTSRKGRNLAQNPEVVVHLESGDEAVILEGRVEEVHDLELLRRMAKVYGAKYEGFEPNPEGDPENVYYALHPKVVFGWLEKEYPRTATRWRFSPV